MAVVSIKLALGKSRFHGLGWQPQDGQAAGVTGVDIQVVFLGNNKNSISTQVVVGIGFGG